MLPVDWEFPKWLGGDAHHLQAANWRNFAAVCIAERVSLRSCLCIRCGTSIALVSVINGTMSRTPLRPASYFLNQLVQETVRTGKGVGAIINFAEVLRGPNVHRRKPPLHRFHPAQEENAMLVLSRKRGERIVIGPNIELTVVDIRGNKVRLAVDAPRDVSIQRQENISTYSRREPSRVATP